jgi:tetratricopeptide (TPR) repeat protein
MPWVTRTFLHLSDNKKSRRHCTRYRRSRIFSLGWIIGFLIFNGCATVPTETWDRAFDHVPPKHELSAVPFFPQKEYQCGPASLAMALAWSGLQITPDELTPQVYTPSLKGSLQPAMLSATRRHGRVAYPISGADALIKEIAAGHPVIVLQNLGLSWIPVWHYAVVIGYDFNKGVIMLNSGITHKKKTALKTFENTWARSKHWGFMALPPNLLPATAEQISYVNAVVGLEKAHQWVGAVEGYKTALESWPQSFRAHIGLGNSYYGLGDLKSAEELLQETTRRFPGRGDAFNNLAQVLWEQGKKLQAMKAARQAVKLGGPNVETYRETLDEIQADTP